MYSCDLPILDLTGVKVLHEGPYASLRNENCPINYSEFTRELDFLCVQVDKEFLLSPTRRFYPNLYNVHVNYNSRGTETEEY